MKIITRTLYTAKLLRDYSFPPTPGSLKSITAVPKGTIEECNKAIFNLKFKMGIYRSFLLSCKYNKLNEQAEMASLFDQLNHPSER